MNRRNLIKSIIGIPLAALAAKFVKAEPHPASEHILVDTDAPAPNGCEMCNHTTWTTCECTNGGGCRFWCGHCKREIPPTRIFPSLESLERRWQASDKKLDSAMD